MKTTKTTTKRRKVKLSRVLCAIGIALCVAMVLYIFVKMAFEYSVTHPVEIKVFIIALIFIPFFYIVATDDSFKDKDFK